MDKDLKFQFKIKIEINFWPIRRSNWKNIINEYISQIPLGLTTVIPLLVFEWSGPMLSMAVWRPMLSMAVWQIRHETLGQRDAATIEWLGPGVRIRVFFEVRIWIRVFFCLRSEPVFLSKVESGSGFFRIEWLETGLRIRIRVFFEV